MMRVTMLQTRMGEAGSYLTSGSTVIVSDAFGQYLVGNGFATDIDGVLGAPRRGPQPVSIDPLTKRVYGGGGAVDLGSGMGSEFIRWCIPGRETSGTLFKDISGKGNDATIEAGNDTPFAVDARMSTKVATNGGISLQLAAGAIDWRTDSALMAFAMTNADPGSAASVASWGAGGGGFSSPGFYLSHRSSAAGVGRAVVNRGEGTLVSGTDSTVKFSNAGGTREVHAILAFDAPTGSLYLYRDGVLAAANVGLVSGGNAIANGIATRAPRLGATGDANTVVGVFRGWQGYAFQGKGLPLNIGRIAAVLAEAASVPLADNMFVFA